MTLLHAGVSCFSCSFALPCFSCCFVFGRTRPQSLLSSSPRSPGLLLLLPGVRERTAEPSPRCHCLDRRRWPSCCLLLLLSLDLQLRGNNLSFSCSPALLLPLVAAQFNLTELPLLVAVSHRLASCLGGQLLCPCCCRPGPGFVLPLILQLRALLLTLLRV